MNEKARIHHIKLRVNSLDQHIERVKERRNYLREEIKRLEKRIAGEKVK